MFHCRSMAKFSLESGQHGPSITGWVLKSSFAREKPRTLLAHFHPIIPCRMLYMLQGRLRGSTEKYRVYRQDNNPSQSTDLNLRGHRHHHPGGAICYLEARATPVYEHVWTIIYVQYMKELMYEQLWRVNAQMTLEFKIYNQKYLRYYCHLGVRQI